MAVSVGAGSSGDEVVAAAPKVVVNSQVESGAT